MHYVDMPKILNISKSVDEPRSVPRSTQSDAVIQFRDPSISGSSSISGRWIDNLFIPSTLLIETIERGWEEPARYLVSHFPDQNFIVSSVLSSIDGRPRSPGSSHIEGHSCDIAPIYDKKTALHPDSRSPRMSDNRALAAFVASIADVLPFGTVMEGDHFHLDRRLPSGCFLYSTYRPGYAKDAANPWLFTSPILKTLFKAESDGTIYPYSF